jgi:hypothetical protein
MAASFSEWVNRFGGILTTSLMCTMANIMLYMHTSFRGHYERICKVLKAIIVPYVNILM